MKKTGISVIVCSYNGATKIQATLAHLANQIVAEHIDWEVIFVDNASTDNTISIAQKEWSKHLMHAVPLLILEEKKPGKLYAFQKAIINVNYSYFIICDDDNWLAPDYLNTAFNILNSDDTIGALGGKTFAVTEEHQQFPNWFEDHQEGYAVGSQSLKTGDITSRGHLWGAGLSSRTALYLEAYRGFPSLLIKDSNPRILSTEDTEYCLRLVLMGYRLYYDESLSLQHFIPPARLTTAYKEALYKNFDDASVILEKYYLAIKFRKEQHNSFLNRMRLIFITPIRILFSSSDKKKSKQRTILSYLMPAFVKPDPTTAQILQNIPPIKSIG